MLLIDAYSKWLEVAKVKTANSTNTIEKLRSMFATHGLPDTVVSDNGTVFTSEEMETFLKENGIQHVRTAPYHPASNGQVERAVQINYSYLTYQKIHPMKTCC
jgi:transposase InsO family protein